VDSLTHIAAHDREDVRLAAANHDLYVPTHLVHPRLQVPYPYAAAPPGWVDALLTTYDVTTRAALRAVRALDSLALALDPRPPVFTTLRAITPLTTAYTPDSPTIPAASSTRRPRPGLLEQTLRSLGIDEPTLLARAADMDDIQDLINVPMTPSQRQAAVNRMVLRAAENPPTRNQPPADLAAQDMPAYTESNTPLPRFIRPKNRIRGRPRSRRGLTP
jgi:hypothetical protein